MEKLTTFQRIEKMHPYKMLLLLSMIGSGIIFLFLLLAYSISIADRSTINEFESVSLPKTFFLSTLFILLAHFTVLPVKEQFFRGALHKMKQTIMLSILLSLAFLICQLIAWRSLKQMGVIFTGHATDSFLYVLSALHGLHLLAVLIFTFSIYFQLVKIDKDPVKYLIAETNPFWTVQLDILKLAWLFLNALWIVVFLFFLFGI